MVTWFATLARCCRFGIFAFFSLFGVPLLLAEVSWLTDGPGSWSSGLHWAGGTVPNGSGVEVSLGGVISAPRTLTIDLAATVGGLSIDSLNAYTIVAAAGGQLILNNGGEGAAVNVVKGSHAIAAPVLLAETAEFAINGTQLSVSGPMSGTGGLIKSGSGLLALTGSNSYSGGTTINNGTLQIQSEGSAMGSAGSLGLVPLSFSAQSLIINGGRLQAASALTLHANRGIAIGVLGATFGAGAGNLFVNGVISDLSGPGKLTVAAGGGVYVPAAQNTYSGGTVVQAGATVIPTVSSSGPAGAPTSGPLGTGTLTLAGGSMRATTNGPVTLGNRVVLDANTTFVSAGLNTDRNLILSGPMQLTGTYAVTVLTSPAAGFTGVFFNGAIGDGGGHHGLVKKGVGTLVLGGASTFSGGLEINAGAVIAIGNASALGGGMVFLGDVAGSENVVLYGGDAINYANAITVRAGSTGTATLANRNPSATTFSGSLVLQKALILSGTSTGSLMVSGPISGAANLTVTGSAGNSVRLSGNNAAFTGAVRVAGNANVTDSAVLRISHGAALGNVAGSSGTVVENNARLELAGEILVENEALTISGSGANNLGALHSIGTNTWGGLITLATVNGTVRFGSSAADSSHPGLLIITGSIGDGAGSSSLGIRTADSSTLAHGVEIRSSGNTYKGNTDVIVGLLRLGGGDDRLPVGTLLQIGNAANTSRACFDLNGFNQQIAGLVSSGTTMMMEVTSATPGTLTVNVPGTRVYAGTIKGAVSLKKEGAGVQTLGGGSFVAGSNTYTGDTTINEGTLRAASVNAFSASSAVVMGQAASSRLDLADYDQVIGSLEGGGNAGDRVLIRSATLWTGGNDRDTTYKGGLWGTGNLVKQGTGAFRLAGINTYSGTTAVLAGSLLVNGSTQSSLTTVANHAVLGGTGKLFGSAAIQSGGWLSPGDPGVNQGLGVLQVASGLVLESGSTLRLEVRGSTNSILTAFNGFSHGSVEYEAYVLSFDGTATAEHDWVIVTNESLTVQSDVRIEVVGQGLAAAYGQVFNLLDWAGLAAFSNQTGDSRDGGDDSAWDLDLPSLAGTGLYWDTTYFDSHGILVVVPELGRMGLLVAASFSLVLRRRRRQMK